jgi:glycosyltransferase involved in cell wall biosynthesis
VGLELGLSAMHLLFVHQNFPAQFGHVARYLIREHGFRCTFVSTKPPGEVAGIRRIQYRPDGGAAPRTHYCARGFENAVAHAMGVYNACRAHPDIQPDLVVGHSGFGSTLFLHELYRCPIINYFEYFYRAHNSDLDFRPDFRVAPLDVLRSYCRNAMLLLDLQYCAAGYCPTHWQHSTLPPAYAGKVEVIFDGVDREIWRRHDRVPRLVGNREVPADTRIVTYVSRGFESMRGFDIFMKTARRIYQERPDVVFAVVGEDRVAYGGDLKYIPETSFKEHVLKQDDYDLSKFAFLGRIPPAELARLLSISDAHLYLTVPFVLSWSLFDAMACGCPIVASATAPVQEVIQHEVNGLLADFFDVEGLAQNALRILRDPHGHRFLGEAAIQLIEERYCLTQTLPQMLELYQRVVSGAPATDPQSGPPMSIPNAEREPPQLRAILPESPKRGIEPRRPDLKILPKVRFGSTARARTDVPNLRVAPTDPGPGGVHDRTTRTTPPLDQARPTGDHRTRPPDPQAQGPVRCRPGDFFWFCFPVANGSLPPWPTSRPLSTSPNPAPGLPEAGASVALADRSAAEVAGGDLRTSRFRPISTRAFAFGARWAPRLEPAAGDRGVVELEPGGPGRNLTASQLAVGLSGALVAKAHPRFCWRSLDLSMRAGSAPVSGPTVIQAEGPAPFAAGRTAILAGGGPPRGRARPGGWCLRSLASASPDRHPLAVPESAGWRLFEGLLELRLEPGSPRGLEPGSGRGLDPGSPRGLEPGPPVERSQGPSEKPGPVPSEARLGISAEPPPELPLTDRNPPRGSGSVAAGSVARPRQNRPPTTAELLEALDQALELILGPESTPPQGGRIVLPFDPTSPPFQVHTGPSKNS